MVISKDELKSIVSARCGLPQEFLGMHKCKGGIVVRAYIVNAKSCHLVDLRKSARKSAEMEKLDPSGFFELFIKGARKPFPYRFRVERYDGEIREFADAYSFPPSLTDEELYLFGLGDDRKVYEHLGSHLREIDGVKGTAFAVWAPTARRVSVVGDFDEWDGRYFPMRPLETSGVWEIFIPGVGEGAKYKYEILAANNDTPFLKSDPYAVRFEPPPHNSSVVCDISGYGWSDEKWIKNRRETDWAKKPVSVYEVHLGSWKRVPEDGFRPLSYAEIGRQLAEYCVQMNFTHVEFMPLTEYPFDGSWGYQVTGFYAPTHRYGSPREFMEMVDVLHQNGIGVIMDWVPAHFPRDAFALAGFDGSCLYEHEDPRLGANPDWGTLCFNYGRKEVANFLLGSALAWLDRFHIDGLRFDAVASMLYLNFSRDNWIPNKYGGSENLDAIDFLKHVNSVIHSDYPGTITIAEESTTFAGVTKPVGEGGLGFDFKWNLGWMHDTLDYLKEDPINRKYHHNKMTFPSMFQFTEKFMLVYSHDEVVHGKSPMVGKMGSGYWDDKIATLRALYAYMWMWPGKKTLFMGDEIAQGHEWRYDESLEWSLLKYIQHEGVRESVRDVAKLYLSDAELAENDFNSIGFEWINADDGDNSVFSFLRFTSDGKRCYATVSNFTPVEQRAYRLGLPCGGVWKEVLNTDAKTYGGGGRGNMGKVEAVAEKAANRRPFGCDMVVPPLSTVVLLGYL
ncbi:MAG TPA: 1,4-alpha-glucan branching protein GlgB [Candidatus Merdousia gallistercoris]|nr:1,4-alpha-glucan branching protein GlgB [Candidatus Merdousia gallistercoris]